MAGIVKDFMTDADDDLVIKDGDFLVELSDEQHVEDIVRSTPGTWKQNPLTGVGVMQFLEGGHSRANLDVLKKKIQQQLTGDGYRVNDVTVKIAGGEIQTIGVNAER